MSEDKKEVLIEEKTKWQKYGKPTFRFACQSSLRLAAGGFFLALGLEDSKAAEVTENFICQISGD